MLQSIRDGAQNWAGIIIAIICIPFAFWGVTSYLGGSQSSVVAEVGDQEITTSEFNREFQYRYRQATQRGEADEQQVKLATLNFLIDQAAVQDWIDSTGYAVDDQALRKDIYFDPRFQEEGQFSEQVLERTLTLAGLNLEEYKARRSEDLARDQLTKALYDSTIVPSSELARTVRLREQERQIEYVRLSLDDAIAKVEVSDDEIQAQYDRNPARYMTQERVKADYILLEQDALLKDIELTDDEMRQEYSTNLQAYTPAERRKTSHILIALDDDTSADQAQEKAQQLAEQLAAGSDFAALAAEESDDPASASDGGSLGWLERGDPFAEPFGDRLFELAVGEISEPIETDYGYHLIRVDEAEGGGTPAFEDVREDIASTLKRDLVAERYLDMLSLLKDASYETPDSLAPAAEAVGIALQQTEWFTATAGEGVAENADARAAVFDPIVLEDGDNTNVISLGPDRSVVLRVAEREEPRQQELDEVKDDIVAALKRQKATRQITEAGRNMLTEAKAGKSLAELAQAQDLDVETSGYIQRTNNDVEPLIRDRAFSLPPAADGQTAATNVRLPGGDYVVVAVTDMRDGDPGTLDEANKQALQGALATTQSRREQVALLLEVRRVSDVKMKAQQI